MDSKASTTEPNNNGNSSHTQDENNTPAEGDNSSRARPSMMQSTTLATSAMVNTNTEDNSVSHAPLPTPATTAVLTTVELLEQILLHVDMRTLLLSQRVSFTWFETILESKRLKQKLFFADATRAELPGLLEFQDRPTVDTSGKNEDPTVPPNIWQMGETTIPYTELVGGQTILFNPLLLQISDVGNGTGEQVLQFRQDTPQKIAKAMQTKQKVSDPRYTITDPHIRTSRDRMLLIHPVAGTPLTIRIGHNIGDSFCVTRNFSEWWSHSFGTLVNGAESALANRACPGDYDRPCVVGREGKKKTHEMWIPGRKVRDGEVEEMMGGVGKGPKKK